MITEKTVFILGAGASNPYRYPTGNGLYRAIYETRDYEHIITAFFSRGGKTIFEDERQDVMKLIEDFQRKLFHASFNSIDFFLESNTDFMKLGKMFIANILIKYEHPTHVYNAEEGWYNYLLNNLLLTAFEDFPKNQVAFLTFNYDRSLEYFLFHAIKYGFSKSDKETVSLLENFPIVHLYGSLGPLPWQSSEGYDYVTGKHLVQRFESANETLHLIGSERTQHFEKAHKLIENASRICFLGFGYHKENLERLNVSLMRNKEVIGSAFGIEDAETKAIETYFASKGKQITLGNKYDKCLAFLRKIFKRTL